VSEPFFRPSTDSTVSVPPPFQEVFGEAERLVGEYFREVRADPSQAFIGIGGERYLLVRASAFSIDFLETVCQLYADRGREKAMAIGQAFLFDISHSIGMNDARAFHRRMGITDPVAKLSAGPVLFAYTGWASVHLLPESNPSPDEDYVIYYHHPYSFEADAWLRSDLHADSPVCIMNAGYSSGWCEESFGLPLTALEVECKAMGHDHCRFVMAPPHRIEEHLVRMGERAVAHKEGSRVPTFFERKQTEDRMRELQGHLLAASRRAGLAEAATGVLHNLGNGLNSVQASVTEMRELLSDSSLENLSKSAALISQQDDLPEFFANDEKGKRLPAYLCRLSDKLGEEHSSILQQLSRLEAKVTHLTEVVGSQQQAARAGRVSQELSLESLVEEALLLARARLEQAEVALEVDCQPGWVALDKGGVLQILTNLLHNAADAVEGNPVGDRCVDLKARVDRELLVFEVKDNGVGIEADHLDAIFRHGFTTKPNGHGFGLHSAAVLAASFGGELTAHSGGAGQGADFVLSLPKGTGRE
jgi:signal transduction histidine kinase